MIKFFRHIRQTLIMENKTSKYLKYAIGEIVLVVIGILIALQVNNWNSNRLEAKKEKKVLQNLNEEFRRNKKNIQNFSASMDKCFNANMLLLDLCDSENQAWQVVNVDSIFNISFEHIDFENDPRPIFDQIMNSDKLENLSNSALKIQLSNLQVSLNWNEDNFSLLDRWNHDQLHPFLIKHSSYKNWDYTIKSSYVKKKSRLFKDYDPLFNSLEFENMIDNKIYFLNKIKQNYERIDKQLDTLIQLTN